eukprot:scaffold96682_cov56-Phaeocystis_antarctica.AAC.1
MEAGIATVTTTMAIESSDTKYRIVSVPGLIWRRRAGRCFGRSRAASATVARASRSRVSCTDPPRQASEHVSQQVSEQARSKQEASK